MGSGRDGVFPVCVAPIHHLDWFGIGIHFLIGGELGDALENRRVSGAVIGRFGGFQNDAGTGSVAGCKGSVVIEQHVIDTCSVTFVQFDADL